MSEALNDAEAIAARARVVKREDDVTSLGVLSMLCILADQVVILTQRQDDLLTQVDEARAMASVSDEDRRRDRVRDAELSAHLNGMTYP